MTRGRGGGLRQAPPWWMVSRRTCNRLEYKGICNQALATSRGNLLRSNGPPQMRCWRGRTQLKNTPCRGKERTSYQRQQPSPQQVQIHMYRETKEKT